MILSEQKYNQFLESIKDWDTIQCVDWINDNRHLFNSGNKDFIPKVFAVFSPINKNLDIYKLKRIQILSLLLLTSNYPYEEFFAK